MDQAPVPPGSPGPPSRLTRRLALLGLAGGGLAAAGCAPGKEGSTSSPDGPSRTTPPPTDQGSSSPSSESSTQSAPSAQSELETTGPDLVRGPADRRVVALTFHGAGAVHLAREVLSIAAATRTRITVFAVGQWLERNQDLGREIAAAGHDLGNHTWSHRVMTRLDAAEARQEVQRGADAVAAVLGRPGSLFRPSGTQTSTAVIRAAAHVAGYHRCVSYDVDSLDYLDPGPTAVRTRTLTQVRPGSIVSLHLGHRGTVEALPGILARLAARALTPVAVTEMFRGH